MTDRLPHGWIRTKISEIVELRREKALPAEMPNAPFLGLEDVEAHTSRIIKFGRAGDMKSAGARFYPGDILYSRLRPYLNKVVIAENEGLASAEFLVLRPAPGVEADFVRRRIMMDDFLAFTANLDRGDRPRVDFAQISAFPVKLPPLSEQRRIAAKLDSLTERTTSAQSELDHIPGLIERYKQALIVAAFRGQLTGAPQDNLRTIETTSEYRQFISAPRSWKLLTLEDVCRIEGGSQPPKSVFSYEHIPGYVRLIQIRDYKSDDHLTYIPRAMARKFCKADDIMIGRYGPPVFQILEGLDGAYNVALMKAVPDLSLITREFLFNYLKHPVLRTFVEIDSKRTAGQDGVNKAHLMKFPIFVPPISDQIAITDDLRRALARVDSISTEVAHAAAQVEHYDRAVAAKAFRGDLVECDLDELR